MKNFGLVVNMTRTKYMCVGEENRNLVLENGVIICSCEEYEYLGISNSCHKQNTTVKSNICLILSVTGNSSSGPKQLLTAMALYSYLITFVANSL